MEHIPYDCPEPEVVSGELEYEVETILDKHIIRNKLQYLIKWKGYPDYESSWELLDNLSNCSKLITEYKRNNAN